MKKLKVQENILQMIKDTDKILDNKDKDQYDVAQCEKMLEKIKKEKDVLGGLKVGKSDEKQHADLLNFYDNTITAFTDLKESMKTLNEMNKTIEEFTKSIEEATKSLEEWAKILDEKN
ncbi:MAG: hypothetical protein N4A62_20005 [Marinisporobacter sp.]|jgi:DNA repair ATPase RecN|nr:hypothetical protein [Marinisporobacter sp.]